MQHLFEYFNSTKALSSWDETSSMCQTATPNSTLVETEELIYPWTSLVAEFGGALGLFLGVSFMTIWDGIHLIKPCFKC